MGKLTRSWQAWRELSPRHRRLVFKAWLLLALTGAGLKLFGYQGTRRWLLSDAPGPPSGADAAKALLITRIVGGAAAWNPLSATCLVRSLVLCRLLRSEGLAADLRIGVARPGGAFRAHAWVEHHGVALGEPEDVAGQFLELAGLVRGREP